MIGQLFVVKGREHEFDLTSIWSNMYLSQMLLGTLWNNLYLLKIPEDIENTHLVYFYCLCNCKMRHWRISIGNAGDGGRSDKCVLYMYINTKKYTSKGKTIPFTCFVMLMLLLLLCVFYAQVSWSQFNDELCTVCILKVVQAELFSRYELCSKSMCIWYHVKADEANSRLCHFCIHHRNRHEGSNNETVAYCYWGKWIMRSIMKEITEASFRMIFITK